MSQCRGWEGRNPRYLSLWWQRLRLRDVARFSQGAALGFLPRSACLPLKPPSSHGGNQIGQNRTDTASHTVCMMSTSSEALAAFSWSPVTSVSLFLCFMLFHDCARRDCRPHQHDRKLICESYLLEYVIPPPTSLCDQKVIHNRGARWNLSNFTIQFRGSWGAKGAPCIRWRTISE